MEFDLVKLRISIQTRDPVRLLSWLPTCGKDFAAVCKKSVCRHSSIECSTCGGTDACRWYPLFGQQLSHDPAALKRYQKPPLPFAFSFPAAEQVVARSETVECGVVLVGSAIHHLNPFVDAFAELCLSGHAPVPCKVASIESLDLQGKGFPLDLDAAGLSGAGNLVVLSADEIMDSRGYDSPEITIRLLSPLRLQENGRLANRFDFCRFAGSVMRRVSSLAYYYGDHEFASDFKMLSRTAQEVICTEYRYGKAASGISPVTGMCGYGSFIGDFNRLMPFLLLGACLNVGKGAAYGMGRYEVVV